ncbi:MAG: hypothetical protein H6613_12235 [Ignavibacteriales bacterium]|nr:hypothetical protein [Ignavibacteriota bacterium]MCB9249244.1 hypothetical protein [Ignavibacteriales bacterium]
MQFRFLKIFLSFAVLFLFSCENIPTDVIDVKNVDYIVENISAPNDFIYSATNTILQASVSINKAETVKQVWFNINNEDGTETISENNILEATSASEAVVFSGETILSNTLLSGKYEISFYVQDNINPSDANVKKIGTKILNFQSEAINLPPEISNLVMPTEVNRGNDFIFSINVVDPNGLTDLQAVYFELRRPDSSIVYADQNNTQTKFPLFDNGDFIKAGDLVRGDGIYSLKNSFVETSQTGNWYFEFAAIDKAGLKSNTINFSLKVN